LTFGYDFGLFCSLFSKIAIDDALQKMLSKKVYEALLYGMFDLYNSLLLTKYSNCANANLSKLLLRNGKFYEDG